MGAKKCRMIFHHLKLHVFSSWPTVIHKKLSNTKGKNEFLQKLEFSIFRMDLFY